VSTDPRHEASWQLLPWLANGRLAAGERAWLEEHVESCSACARELDAQRLLCATLAAPERVTYAPGPSLRKLLERIDGTPARAAPAVPAPQPRAPSPPLGRPPVLAWAASVLLVLGTLTVWRLAAHWQAPSYLTHTSPAAATPGVVHIAFDPAVSVAQASALLRAAGARVVDGPDASGVFALSPADGAGAAPLRALAARLRADARVRWVEPAAATPAAGTPEP
jgi:hypothetical protein